MPIGVDEWVAQHEDRADVGRGWRGTVARRGARIGWWPRLGLALLAGLIFSQLSLNVNVQTVAINCMIYAILAVGLNIAVGWAGLLDLGYVAFFGFGAYGYALFSSGALGSGGAGGSHLPAIESIPIVLAGAGILGALIGLMSLRVSGDYLAIVTLFVGQAFFEVVNNVDTGTLGGVNGIYGLDPVHGFGGQITTPKGYYIFALLVLAVLMALLHLLDNSRTGRGWRAVREDELAAEAMTVSTGAVKVMAVSFGAIVGALAGTIFAAQQDNVFPTNFTANIMILIYACLVLGGAGSIAGAVLGGILVTAGEQMVSSPTDAGYLFYGLILLALLMKVRPWRVLAAVVAGTVVLGVALHAIVNAISASAVAGQPGSGGWIGSLVSHWVIVPAHAATYGNVLYIVTIVLVFAIVRAPVRYRPFVLMPTIYVAACCWESRLVVNPSITAQILIGAILIATMTVRPQGLLGTMRVEVV
ncbi:MAG TPA: branched-chain amino acid ABC transporter permease [Solirubrobacteraceae bacterium]|nr:branched-chain amino acid ABC transporter permease [Solirubrobacteraceae bacterium]